MSTDYLQRLQDVGLFYDPEYYNKTKTITRFQFTALFNDIFPFGSTPLSRVEYTDGIPYYVERALRIAEDWNMVLRGLPDKPISYERIKG